MPQVIHEMSHKKLGMTTVLEAGALVGMISDGISAACSNATAPHISARAHRRRDQGTLTPRTIDGSGLLAAAALALMEERKITSLIVTGVEPISCWVSFISTTSGPLS